MVILVKLLGIIIVVFGVIYLLKPSIMKSYISFWKRGKRLYIGGILSLLIGVILLLAASQCRMSWFVAAFGILGLSKGIVLLVLREEKMRTMINWWAERPIAFLRVHALFALVVGALLIYSA
ncbi:MAG: hypothetical protein ISS44_01000 [Candidatus Omnitrophica bacterium]|nr:hypothetical protein [Candidatus Omnitrophota bacterium]